MSFKPAITVITLLLASIFSYGQSSDWYILTHEGDTIKKVTTTSIKPGGDFIEIKKGNKLGYIDYAGRVVAKTQFENAKGHSKGMACVMWQGKYGYMDGKGRMVIDARYEDAQSFRDDLAAVRLGNKWGYIDEVGKMIVNHKFEEVRPFSQGMAMVRKTWEKTWGMINKSGNYAIENKYQALRPASNDLIAFRLEGKWGYLDLFDKVVIPNEFKLAYAFSEGYAFAGSDYELGVIDTKGNRIGKPIYEKFKQPGFREGMAAVRKRGKWGFINTASELVIPAEYEDVGYFAHGLAPVKVDGLWGYIDKEGTIVIPNQYKEAYPIAKIRKRPVIIVKGAPMKPIVIEPEVEEEEEVVEESEETDEEETEAGSEKEETVETDEEEMNEEKTPEIKETKKPVKEEEVAEKKEEIVPATDEEYLAFFDALGDLQESVDEAMEMGMNSGDLMYEAHESGKLDVYATNSEAATDELKKSKRKLLTAKAKVKAGQVTSESMIKCTSMKKLLGTTKNKIIGAEKLLKEAEGHLEQAFKEEAYLEFKSTIGKYIRQLDDVSSSINDVNYALEVCLGMD